MQKLTNWDSLLAFYLEIFWKMLVFMFDNNITNEAIRVKQLKILIYYIIIKIKIKSSKN